MRILVTGATGLLGGEVTAQLLREGHSVVALIHQRSDFTDNDGQQLVSRDVKFGWPAAGQLAHVKGNIAESGLGLSPKQQGQLTKEINLIVHCAALTAFDADEASYRAINEGGTSNLLELFPHVPFLHVSTAYVCGDNNGLVCEEAILDETQFTNGYEASKAKAERLVKAAVNPSVIVRPSIIVGNHHNGQIGGFDNFYRLFKLMAEGRISTIPAAPDASLDFVPINHVVGGIMDVVAHWEEARGKIIHLTSSSAAEVTEFAKAMAVTAGIHSPKIVPLGKFSPTMLSPRERRIHRKFLGHYLPYFQRGPVFQNAALANLSGRSCPEMDLAALGRQIQYCIDSGYIAPAQMAEFV